MQFDLVLEPCVPVVMLSGERLRLSLRDVLVRAHEIRDVDPAIGPLRYAGVMSLLLALTLDIVRLPDLGEWERRWRAQGFPEAEVDAFFAACGERFDLWHPVTPFMQAPGLEAANGETRPVSALDPAIASGNNVPLLSTSTDADPSAVKPEDAWMLLLLAHGFSTAGLIGAAADDREAKAGKTAGNQVPPTGAIGHLWLRGESLFESLMLMHTATDGRDEERDEAVWRRAADTGGWQTRPARGLRDLLTWQGRRVRLVADHDGLVRRVVMTAGDRLSVPTNADPRCAWVADSRRGAVSDRKPFRLLPGRSAWQGMEALIAIDGGNGVTTSLPIQQLSEVRELDADLIPLSHAIGATFVTAIYGTQNAVIETVIADSVPLPLAALAAAGGADVRRVLRAMVANAEAVRRSLEDLSTNIRQCIGAEKVPWDKGAHPGEQLISAVALDAQRMLAGLRRQPERAEEALLAWQMALNAHADQIAGRIIEPAYEVTFIGDPGNDHRKAMSPALAERFYRSAVNKALPELMWTRAHKAKANREGEEQVDVD